MSDNTVHDALALHEPQGLVADTHLDASHPPEAILASQEGLSPSEEAQALLNRDDVFIMNHLSFQALQQDQGERALPLYETLHAEAPEHAASFMLHAMYLCSVDKLDEAIQVMEEGEIFRAERARDEAIAFHIYLLQQDGQERRCRTLARTVLDEDLVTAPGARRTIEAVLDQFHPRPTAGRSDTSNARTPDA